MQIEHSSRQCYGSQCRGQQRPMQRSDSWSSNTFAKPKMSIPGMTHVIWTCTHCGHVFDEFLLHHAPRAPQGSAK